MQMDIGQNLFSYWSVKNKLESTIDKIDANTSKIDSSWPTDCWTEDMESQIAYLKESHSERLNIIELLSRKVSLENIKTPRFSDSSKAHSLSLSDNSNSSLMSNYESIMKLIDILRAQWNQETECISRLWSSYDKISRVKSELEGEMAQLKEKNNSLQKDLSAKDNLIQYLESIWKQKVWNISQGILELTI